MDTVEIKDIPGYENIKLIKVPEDWDASNNNQIKETIESCINKGFVNLIFDLSSLRFIDSVGNLCLINCQIKAKKQLGCVNIFGVNKYIREIFDTIGTSKLISIFNSCESALSNFKQ